MPLVSQKEDKSPRKEFRDIDSDFEGEKRNSVEWAQDKLESESVPLLTENKVYMTKIGSRSPIKDSNHVDGVGKSTKNQANLIKDETILDNTGLKLNLKAQANDEGTGLEKAEIRIAQLVSQLKSAREELSNAKTRETRLLDEKKKLEEELNSCVSKLVKAERKLAEMEAGSQISGKEYKLEYNIYDDGNKCTPRSKENNWNFLIDASQCSDDEESNSASTISYTNMEQMDHPTLTPEILMSHDEGEGERPSMLWDVESQRSSHEYIDDTCTRSLSPCTPLSIINADPHQVLSEMLSPNKRRKESEFQFRDCIGQSPSDFREPFHKNQKLAAMNPVTRGKQWDAIASVTNEDDFNVEDNISLRNVRTNYYSQGLPATLDKSSSQYKADVGGSKSDVQMGASSPRTLFTEWSTSGENIFNPRVTRNTNNDVIKRENQPLEDITTVRNSNGLKAISQDIGKKYLLEDKYLNSTVFTRNPSTESEDCVFTNWGNKAHNHPRITEKELERKSFRSVSSNMNLPRNRHEKQGVQAATAKDDVEALQHNEVYLTKEVEGNQKSIFFEVTREIEQNHLKLFKYIEKGWSCVKGMLHKLKKRNMELKYYVAETSPELYFQEYSLKSSIIEQGVLEIYKIMSTHSVVLAQFEENLSDSVTKAIQEYRTQTTTERFLEDYLYRDLTGNVHVTPLKHVYTSRFQHEPHRQVAPRGSSIENNSDKGPELHAAYLHDSGLDGFEGGVNSTSENFGVRKSNALFSDVYHKERRFDSHFTKEQAKEKLLLKPAPQRGKSRVGRKRASSSTLFNRIPANGRWQRKRRSKKQCSSTRVSSQLQRRDFTEEGNFYTQSRDGEKFSPEKDIRLTSVDCRFKSCEKRDSPIQNSRGVLTSSKIFV